MIHCYFGFIPFQSFLFCPKQEKTCTTCCSIFSTCNVLITFTFLAVHSNYFFTLFFLYQITDHQFLPLSWHYTSILSWNHSFKWTFPDSIFSFSFPFFLEKLIKSRKSSSPISGTNDDPEVKNRHRDQNSPGKDKWHLTWSLNE